MNRSQVPVVILYLFTLLILIRYGAQNDEIARLQLENGVLQEKLTNEKRKVSLLEVS